MLGKVIILIILGMLAWAGYTKLAGKLGLAMRKKPVSQPPPKPLWSKFNIIIAGLICVYIIWGAVQIFG